MMSDTHVTNCELINIVGAYYKVSSVIILKLFKKGEKQYINVYLDDYNCEYCCFLWNDIPKDLLDIYNYLNMTSKVKYYDNKYVLYGPHIGRFQNSSYNIISYEKNPYDDKMYISDNTTSSTTTSHFRKMYYIHTCNYHTISKEISSYDTLSKELIKNITNIAENMRIAKGLI